jgi:hypothetical protein
MGKSKQKQVELLQDFFLTRKNMTFDEIDWKYIFRWLNTLNIDQELESLAKNFKIKSICLYGSAGKLISFYGEKIDWENMASYFSLYGQKWIKSHSKDTTLFGTQINNIKGEQYHCLMVFDRIDFRVENCNMISQVFKLLSISFSKGLESEGKVLPIVRNPHPFPVIEPGKIHILRCANLNNLLPSIKQTLNQLGHRPQLLGAGDIKLEKEEKNLVQIVLNIQNWEHLQEEFIHHYEKALSKGLNPTLLLCFDSDPFYLYQKERLLEKIHHLISPLPLHEYSMDPIIESTLDENKILDIIDTVWTGEEKQSA